MLVRAPVPEQFEGGASWFSRLALSQFASLKEILALLDLQSVSDLDFAFMQREARRRIAKMVQVDEAHFRFMGHMFNSLHLADPAGFGDYLLTEGGHPRYRFCAECLKIQRTPHFPVHWRFKAWRWCSHHRSLLRDRCPNCGALAILPSDLNAAIARKHRPQLHCCAVCGGKLSNADKKTRFSATRNFLTPWEQLLIGNGRAVLAALATRRVIVGADRQPRPLRELRRLKRSGFLPHNAFRYESLDLEETCFRDPHTGRVVAVRSRAIEQSDSRRWVRGLFDG